MRTNRGIFSTTPADQRLQVLLVEDEALLRWSIAEVLRRRGHTVVEATSASTARAAMADGHAIDVVLLDYRLPDSNDLGLLTEVRRRLPQSAVVLMTAYTTPDLVDGAARLGAYSVVTKPFDLHGLEALLKTAHHAVRPH